MKLNKKIGMLVLSSVLSMGMLAGCGNSKNTVTENKTEIVIENQDTENFKNRDVLTYEIKTKRDGDYLDMEITITNNGDKPINNYWLTFGLYDENGTKIGDAYAADSAVLQPGKSCVLETATDKLNAKDMQLVEYNYDVPSEKEQVIINKEISTVDVYDIE